MRFVNLFGEFSPLCATPFENETWNLTKVGVALPCWHGRNSLDYVNLKESFFVASHLYFITFIIFPRDQYVDKTPTNTGRVAIQSNRTEINPQTNVANACNSEAFEEMPAPCIIPSSHPSLDMNDDYWLMRQNSGRAAVQNNKFEINPGQNAANIGWVTFIVCILLLFFLVVYPVIEV